MAKKQRGLIHNRRHKSLPNALRYCRKDIS